MPRMVTATHGMSPPRGRNDNVELSAKGGGSVSGIPPGVAVGTLYEAANHPHSPAGAHHYAAAAAAAMASSSPVAHSMAGLYYQDRRGGAAATAAGATTPTRNHDPPSLSLMGHHHQQEEARSPTRNQEAPTRPANFPCPQPGAPRGSTVQPAEPSLPRTRLGRRILTTKPQRQPDLVVAKFDQATTPTSSTRLLDCTDVECATCSNSLQIPKSAVVVMCPICDQVNPVASCRVK
jgi:LSD1 subclass zinc finger protein